MRGAPKTRVQDAPSPGTQPREAIAADDKSVRGAAAGGTARPHLLAAASHDGGVVLAQHQIPDKGSEITELPALHTALTCTAWWSAPTPAHPAGHRQLARLAWSALCSPSRQNQPTLLAACHNALSGPSSDFAPEHVEYSRGHGCTEQRTTRTKTITPGDGIDFPHAAQVFRIRRDVGGLDGQRTHKEVAHCITSLPTPAGAKQLAGYTRAHWASRTAATGSATSLRRGRLHAAHRHAPQAMAIIRNLIITAFRIAGWANLARARRHYARAALRCLDLLITRPSKPDKPRS